MWSIPEFETLGRSYPVQVVNGDQAGMLMSFPATIRWWIGTGCDINDEGVEDNAVLFLVKGHVELHQFQWDNSPYFRIAYKGNQFSPEQQPDVCGYLDLPIDFVKWHVTGRKLRSTNTRARVIKTDFKHEVHRENLLRIKISIRFPEDDGEKERDSKLFYEAMMWANTERNQVTRRDDVLDVTMEDADNSSGDEGETSDGEDDYDY